MDIIQKITSVIVASATTNSAAAIDISQDSVITGIQGIIQGEYTTPATGSVYVGAELSFLSTNQININDARGSLCEVVASGVILSTEGGYKLSECIYLSHLDVNVAAGERIHLHTISSVANLVGQATFLLGLSATGVARRAPRRR